MSIRLENISLMNDPITRASYSLSVRSTPCLCNTTTSEYRWKTTLYIWSPIDLGCRHLDPSLSMRWPQTDDQDQIPTIGLLLKHEESFFARRSSRQRSKQTKSLFRTPSFVAHQISILRLTRGLSTVWPGGWCTNLSIWRQSQVLFTF